MRALLLAGILGLGIAACGTDPLSDEGGRQTTGTAGINAAPECNPLTVRAAPLLEQHPLLVATGNIPLPTLQPDAEGYFHPEPGYTEGGTFRLATAKATWVVKPSDIAPRAPRGTMRMGEWNVGRGENLDGIVRLMKKINADVWAINESDLYGTNSGGVVVARELAKALGYSYYTAIEFYERRDDRRGTSGNAILSRFPIDVGRAINVPAYTEAGGYDWSMDGGQPRCGGRGALAATISFPTATGGSLPVDVISLHTENKANAAVRVKQYETALAELVQPGAPTIVAGDFNTVSPGEGGRFRDYLAAKVTKDGRADAMFDCSRGDNAATFSVLFVALRIDWMLVQSGAGAKLDCPVGGYRVVGHDGASDHKVLVTEFTVGDATGADSTTDSGS